MREWHQVMLVCACLQEDVILLCKFRVSVGEYFISPFWFLHAWVRAHTCTLPLPLPLSTTRTLLSLSLSLSLSLNAHILFSLSLSLSITILFHPYKHYTYTRILIYTHITAPPLISSFLCTKDIHNIWYAHTHTHTHTHTHIYIYIFHV